jgi:hypothetical protein
MNQHYRVYKLNDAGRIVKGKDVEAPSDEAAMQHAHDDEDCPVCEVWKGAEPIGKIG